MNFKNILERIVIGENLQSEEAEFALKSIISGELTEAEVAAFLFGMRSKGETIEELTSFVKVMRKAAVKVDIDATGAVDMCGTGGDHSGTFNISTAAMFVVAGAGVPVLKHGNRGISSKSGSYDVLLALGIVPDLGAEKVKLCFEETGMAFMFAPLFHPAMKHVMPARRNLGIRTFFNILGPLLNPAGVRRQVIGAYNFEVAEQMCRILANLNTEFAYTLHANDGLDEISTTSVTEIFEVNHRLSSTAFRFDPASLGFKYADPAHLIGGNAAENAEILQMVFLNKAKSTAEKSKQEIIELNAAFSIHASGKVKNLAEALELAKMSIKNGKAKEKLTQFATVTLKLSKK